jgi:serine/threonine protein phosphatase PrpC
MSRDSSVNDRSHFMDALHYRLFCWFERDMNLKSGWQHLEGDQVAISTDIGCDRAENQDRVVVLRCSGSGESEYLLTAICDGMGGMQDGQICASLAVSGVIVAFLKSHHLAIKDRLLSTTLAANQSVHQRYRGKGGATLSAVCVSSRGETWGLNVGDSRIYGSKSGKLTALSTDDTIAGQIGREGGGGEANSLLQFIGIGSDIDPHIVEIPPDLDRIVITTDGAHGIPRDALALLVTRAQTSFEVCRRVVQAAQWMGTRDNGTVACVQTPLTILPPAVERSVRLWDPWGELHLLNPVDNRPAARNDAMDPGQEKQPDVASNEPGALKIARSERTHGTRKRADKTKVTQPRLPTEDRPTKPSQSIQITEIPEPPDEGDR